MDLPSTTGISILLLFGSALIGGFIAKRMRQPSIVGYIVGGIAIGNIFPLYSQGELLRTISDIGVTLLLFSLGIEFSLHRLRQILRLLVFPVTVQIVVVSLILGVLLAFYGLPWPVILIISFAASLSSTAIVVRTLSERGELDSLPGELATGWLVLQDLAVVPIMIFLSSQAQSMGNPLSAGLLVGEIVSVVIKSVLLLSSVVLLGRFLVPRVLRTFANVGSRELFLIASLGLVLLCSVSTFALGLSAALGAFLAGVIISETTEHHTVFAEIRPLRDVFGVIFFVSIGFALPISSFIAMIPALIVFTIVVMLVKWVVIFGICTILGYHKKTSFLVSVSLIQLSEFGFIIASEGARLGFLTSKEHAFLVALTFLSILMSVPIAANWQRFYKPVMRFIFPLFRRIRPDIFIDRIGDSGDGQSTGLHDHVVICGYGRVGKYIGAALLRSQIPFIVVDYNHATVTRLREHGITALWGDPAEYGVLDVAEVDYAKALVIAIPERHTQELIITNALTLNRNIRILCRTHHEEDQPRLKSLGATYLVQPEFEAAMHMVGSLLENFGVNSSQIQASVSRLRLEHASL